MYAPLAMYAFNTREVSVVVVSRALLIGFILAGIQLLIARAVLRSWGRAGLAVSLLLVLFLSYGHLYNFLKATPELVSLGRHRIIGPLYLMILLAGLLRLVWKVRRTRRITIAMNAAAVILLALPLAQSVYDTLSLARETEQVSKLSPTGTIKHGCDLRYFRNGFSGMIPECPEEQPGLLRAFCVSSFPPFWMKDGHPGFYMLIPGAFGSSGPMRYGRIISLSSCSTMWQCQTNVPALLNCPRMRVTSPG